MYSIDLLQQIEGGGIVLFIVADKPLLPTDLVLDQLKRKVKFYLAEINMLGFQQVWKHPPPEKTNIVIATLEELQPEVKSFVESLRPLVESENARLKTQVFQSEYPEWLVDKLPAEPSLDERMKHEIKKQLERIQLRLARKGFIASMNPTRNSITCVPSQARPELADEGPYCRNAYLVGFENVVVPANAVSCSISFNPSSSRWDVDIAEVAAPGPGNIYLRDFFESPDAAMEAVRNCYSIE